MKIPCELRSIANICGVSTYHVFLYPMCLTQTGTNIFKTQMQHPYFMFETTACLINDIKVSSFKKHL